MKTFECKLLSGVGGGITSRQDDLWEQQTEQTRTDFHSKLRISKTNYYPLIPSMNHIETNPCQVPAIKTQRNSHSPTLIWTGFSWLVLPPSTVCRNTQYSRQIILWVRIGSKLDTMCRWMKIMVLGHILERHNLEGTQPRRTQPRRDIT